MKYLNTGFSGSNIFRFTVRWYHYRVVCNALTFVLDAGDRDNGNTVIYKNVFQANPKFYGRVECTFFVFYSASDLTVVGVVDSVTYR